MARPMPRLLPVTTATFPSRENCESPFMDPSSGRISRDPPGIALDARLIVFPKNRELLRFKRSFGVNCEYGLITAEVASRKVGNQVDRPQPLFGRDAPRTPKVVINIFAGLGISQVFLAWRSDQQTAGQILKTHKGAVIIGREVEFGDIDCCSVRYRDAVFEAAMHCRHFCQHPNSFGI